MTRVRLAFATLLACAAAVGVALVLTSGGSDGEAPSVASNGFAGALRPDIPPKDFVLSDQDGDRVAMKKLRGRVVIVTFLYTHCRDTCPITAQQIRGALDDLGHDVPTLAVSVDPANDTPASAKRFLLRQHLTGRMRFMLGPRARLEPVWRAYGIAPQTRELEHSAYAVLVDKRGRQRVGFPTDKLTPEGLAHDIRRLDAER